MRSSHSELNDLAAVIGLLFHGDLAAARYGWDGLDDLFECGGHFLAVLDLDGHNGRRAEESVGRRTVADVDIAEVAEQVFADLEVFADDPFKILDGLLDFVRLVSLAGNASNAFEDIGDHIIGFVEVTRAGREAADIIGKNGRSFKVIFLGLVRASNPLRGPRHIDIHDGAFPAVPVEAGREGDLFMPRRPSSSTILAAAGSDPKRP